MKYLIYLRVSTEKQDYQTQLDHCLIFLNQQNIGKFEYKVFSDIKTAKKSIDKREGGKALLSAIQPGDIVIGLRVDRMCRSLYETTLLIKTLEEKNADILLVEQPGIKNKILLGIYAGIAEEEVKLLRKRISEKLASKKMRNERYSRYIPYGFRMHETKMVAIRTDDGIIMKRGILIPLPEEQKLMSDIVELHSQGYSYQHIANVMNEQGHRNREGGLFQRMTIYRIVERLAKEKLLMESQKGEAILSSH